MDNWSDFGPHVMHISRNGGVCEFTVYGRYTQPAWEPTVRGGVDFDCELTEVYATTGIEDASPRIDGWNVLDYLDAKVVNEIREECAGRILAAQHPGGAR